MGHNMNEQITSVQALMHLLKAYVGTGILAMPKAFSYSGYVLGAIGTPIIGVLCNSCIHMLCDVNQHLSSQLKCEPMDYEELTKTCIECGPRWVHKFASFAKYLIIVLLIFTQLGFCCSYCLFMSENMRQFLVNMDPTLPNVSMSIQYYLLIILPFIILMNFNKSIRVLTIASGCANVVQLACFGIIIYNLVKNVTPAKNVELVSNQVPLFFSTTVFSFEGITVTMPLYKSMKNKNNFSKLLGVVNCSLVIVVILYLLIGLLGYLQYGSDVQSVITLSLPNEPVYNSVRIMYSLVISISYAVQMHVAIEQLWPRLKASLHDLKMNTIFVNVFEYIFRAFLVIITFALAAFIPRLDLIISLVGAVSCSSVAIIIPPVLHTISYLERDIKSRQKVLIYVRNLVVFLIGLLGFATGTYFSISDIIESFI